MAVLSYPTREHIAMQARPYPDHLLEGSETGLCLFAAAFLGHNDAIHFAMAGMDTTCVDLDGERLREMSRLYPSEWEFLVDDAWLFAEAASGRGDQWDVVSVDPFTGMAMAKSLASLHLWCSLARRVVTVGMTGELIGSFRAPSGWRFSKLYLRTKDVYWLCLVPM